MYLLFIFFSVLFSQITCSYNHILTVKTEPSQKNNNFIKESYLKACNLDYCQIIRAFSINENSNFDCYQQNLPINFDTYNINKSKVLTYGYLPQINTLSNLLTDKQVASPVCQLIKRFFVNFNKILVSISDGEHETISLVDKSKANEYIQNELFKRSYYVLYVLHLFGLFDEKSNETLVLLCIKTICFYFLLSIFALKSLYRLYNAYVCISCLLAEANQMSPNEVSIDQLDKNENSTQNANQNTNRKSYLKKQN